MPITDITITWPTGVINVPKTALTLVQSTPTYIYDLPLDAFRRQLKNLEDDAAGMGFLKTHNHNTEVTLAGLTLARVIEILDPYTITFEDDQYAVNLIGANSNVADKVNVNQVSVRPNNSAGLISSPLIEDLDARTDLIRKILTNRLELEDGDTDNWVLHDDDDSVLLTWSVTDKTGSDIVQPTRAPARRTKAV